MVAPPSEGAASYHCIMTKPAGTASESSDGGGGGGAAASALDTGGGAAAADGASARSGGDIAGGDGSKGGLAQFQNSLFSWQCLRQRQRWFRCLDKDYLALKCFLLERFLHDVLFESRSPQLIATFAGVQRSGGSGRGSGRREAKTARAAAAAAYNAAAGNDDDDDDDDGGALSMDDDAGLSMDDDDDVPPPSSAAAEGCLPESAGEASDDGAAMQ